MLLVSAAVGQGGVQGRQATGVFANEAGASGWSQLIDSVTLHPPPPPLAHEPSAGPYPHPSPTSQSRAPAMLQSHHTADHHHQAPHMADQTQPQPQPAVSHEQLAQAEAAQLGLQFQYDSFSDSMGDELMPDAPSQPPHRPGDSHTHTAAQEAAQPAQQSRTPGEAPPPKGQGPRDEQQQQEVDEQHEQHSRQPAVVPQTDGAGDSDSVTSQDPPVQGTAAKLLPAQQPDRNGRQAYSIETLSEQQAAEPALQADRGLGEHTATAQQQGQPMVSDAAAGTVAAQRPRRRRSRHVVQHAVRLAAAARHAMDSVASPEHAGSARQLQGGAPGHQSEPQLPFRLQPPAAADRVQFQSEPQLPQAWMAVGNGFSGPGADVGMPSGSSAREAELPDGEGERQGQMQERKLHLLKKDSQYGGTGRLCNVTSHHVSQSTVAAPASGSAPDVPSQMVSDSRATSDLQWQQGQQRQVMPTLQHTQRLASQVVSDSRATSDLRWAQHRQMWQASLEQPRSPSAQQHGAAPTQAHELAWEQPASVACKPTSGAASGAASEAADDLEVVISDSQPSPLQKSSR